MLLVARSRMLSGGDMSVDESRFEIFGDKESFALELRHLPNSVVGEEPEDRKGSWGEWRLWIAGLNLCQLRLDTSSGPVEVREIRWFLAPFFMWIIENWMPLLHEKRLPPGGRLGDSRPRSARAAYLAILESAGDDPDRFAPWQCWANRHSLRAAAEGGILPDVFAQRMEDDLEFSWGDRVQPGAGAATFLAEEGVARAAVDAVAKSLFAAVEWFLRQHESNPAPWAHELGARWGETSHKPAGLSALAWYLDSSPEPQALTKKFKAALARLNQPLSLAETPWWGNLSPEAAMFGDLSPNISDDAAAVLLAEYFNARTDAEDSSVLSSLVSDVPAWTNPSPWHSGYSLALDILDEIDPEPKAPLTRIERMLDMLEISVKEVKLGEQGPRGVALAGSNLQATILINLENVQNTTHTGRRFTMAHELCHILFDRNRARLLTHSSTAWASPAVEQRANAFAAMLLMPPKRASLPTAENLAELKHEVNKLADRIKVSRGALRRHLANIDEIGPDELNFLLGQQTQEL